MRYNLLVPLVALVTSLCLSATVSAQSPGGVATNLRLWLKAESLPGANGSNVASWASSVGSYTVGQTTVAQQPILYKTTSTSLVNFNSAVYFNGSDGFGLFNTTRLYSNTAAFSLLTVGVDQRPTGTGTLRATMGIGSDGNYPALDFGIDSYSPNGWNPLMGASSPTEWTGGSARVSTYNPGNPQGNVAALTSNNIVGGTDNIISYVNGYKEATTLDAAQNTQIGNGVYIGSSGDAPYQGLIPEAIAYDQQLSDTDMQKVQSYLAIKYGITLGQSFTTAAGLNSQNYNYVAANGSVIWNASGNVGYNYNIAGIARDDQAGLYQKQSWSVNPGRQVLVSTTGLANTNLANSGTLTNEQYLVWGDNNLAKAPTVPISGISGVNNRFAAIWKVQNNGVGTVRVAWPKGYTNLKLIRSADATIDASDNVTDMTSVQTINGVDYVYADVTLSDGQYFTFAASLKGPGGVTEGILMWHKANDGVVTPGDKAQWQDVSGNARDVSQPDNVNRYPTLQTDATYGSNYFFNFNPSYYFDGSKFFYRSDIYFPSNTSPGSTYGVSQGGGTPYGWGDDDPNLYKSGDSYSIWRDNGSTVSGSVPASGNGVAQIGGMAWKGAQNGIYLNANGRTYTSTTQNIGTIQSEPTNYEFAIGSEGFNLVGGGNERFVGGIPELLAYSVDHQNSTGNEKLRINSYLAIKYGITLSNDDGTGTPNYLSSASAVMWDASEVAFNYNIAGVANDFLSDLHQKQSRSVNSNTNSQVTMGVGGIAATNIANSSTLSDGQFLVWGDNGNTQSLTTAYTSFTYASNTSSRRMNRVWKVQNTNVSNNMLIRFPVASVGTTTLANSDACAQYSIIYASDAAFTTNVSAQTLTTNGTDYEATHSFPAGASYFTFGKVATCSNTPDLTSIIYARPTSIYGTTPVTVVVDVVEIASIPTSGTIVARVSKDSKASLSFNPSATTINGKSVQNNLWTFDGTSNANYYIFTTSSVVAAGSKLSFGMSGTVTPGATTGTLTLSATLVGGSGGEIQVSNNTDADLIDYFQQ